MISYSPASSYLRGDGLVRFSTSDPQLMPTMHPGLGWVEKNEVVHQRLRLAKCAL